MRFSKDQQDKRWIQKWFNDLYYKPHLQQVRLVSAKAERPSIHQGGSQPGGGGGQLARGVVLHTNDNDADVTL